MAICKVPIPSPHFIWRNLNSETPSYSLLRHTNNSSGNHGSRLWLRALSVCHQGEDRVVTEGQSLLILALDRRSNRPIVPGEPLFQLTNHLHGFVREVNLALAPVTWVVKL